MNLLLFFWDPSPNRVKTDWLQHEHGICVPVVSDDVVATVQVSTKAIKLRSKRASERCDCEGLSHEPADCIATQVRRACRAASVSDTSSEHLPPARTTSMHRQHDAHHIPLRMTRISVNRSFDG